MTIKIPKPTGGLPFDLAPVEADFKGAMKPLQTGVPDYYTKLHELKTIPGTTGAEFLVLGSTQSGIRVSVRVWLDQTGSMQHLPKLGDTSDKATLLGIRIRIGDALSSGAQYEQTCDLLQVMDPMEKAFTGGNAKKGYRSIEGHVMVPAAPTDVQSVVGYFHSMGVVMDLLAHVQNIMQKETITFDVTGDKLQPIFSQLIKQALEAYQPKAPTITPGFVFGRQGSWLKHYFPMPKPAEATNVETLTAPGAPSEPAATPPIP